MVKSVLLFVVLFQPAWNSRPIHLKPLPADAKITIETAHWREGHKPDPQIPCPLGPPPTSLQIKKMFATYHVLRDMEYHDGYNQIECVTEGDILVEGKKFRYLIEPINLLYTTWPDGQGHQLGGKHSDTSASQ